MYQRYAFKAFQASVEELKWPSDGYFNQIFGFFTSRGNLSFEDRPANHSSLMNFPRFTQTPQWALQKILLDIPKPIP